ncbi:LamG-like jellyroll fold domain-containing protein [Actinoplanes sp. NPDC051851]|uniref:LamG-like jellyroll fold domain-containing protein n=1 Tax=Actinoplanes sp. NPDC051851 TaxID=3154753 RepID=UPI00342D64BF
MITTTQAVGSGSVLLVSDYRYDAEGRITAETAHNSDPATTPMARWRLNGSAAFKLAYLASVDKWQAEGTVRLADGTSGWWSAASAAGLPALNAWTHLAVVVDPTAGTVKVYVNNAQPSAGKVARSSSVLDEGGLVTRSFDALGNATDVSYDAAERPSIPAKSRQGHVPAWIKPVSRVTTRCRVL